MSTNVDSKTKVLTVLVACLIALAAVQMYFLYAMHQQTRDNIASAATLSNQDNDSAKDKSAPQSFHLVPGPQSGVQTSPLGALQAPFSFNAGDPFKQLDAMHKEMERMFNSAFGGSALSPQFSGLTQGFSLSANTDISETPDNYVVKMDIPGAEKAKINAQLDGQMLVISGEREQEQQQQASGKTVSKQRELGGFERALTLPGPVKKDGMQVNYDKGVLTVTVPKDTTPQKLAPLSAQ